MSKLASRLLSLSEQLASLSLNAFVLHLSITWSVLYGLLMPFVSAIAIRSTTAMA